MTLPTTALGTMLFLCLTAQAFGATGLTRKDVESKAESGTCYVIIDNKVYDISSDIQEHDHDYKTHLKDFCGKDSSKAWSTKAGRGKDHSKKAKLMLSKRFIGELVD